MNIQQLFEELLAGHDLSPDAVGCIMKQCMRGELYDAQIAAFLVLMRQKGESVSELTAAANVMREFAHPIDLGNHLVDIVGTGGDGKNTFNISTVSSFVIAAAGAKVAKHGNRSVSSKSGSADLLLEAGFKLDLPEEALRRCINECNIAFLFAPHFHQAMRHARLVRQQLGIRTLFNLLGPITNPARASHQVVGVFQHDWLMPLAEVLANTGSEHALVVHAKDGLDEISIAAETDIIEYHQGKFKRWTIDPTVYGCAHDSLDGIIVENAKESLALAESVLTGNKGPARDIVLLNSAAAIYCANLVPTYREALAKAADAIDSGQALKCFNQLRILTQPS
ncbi:anthranilate phosphoribosyltransferase [Legionella londiniensis]|uniref:Anthranilate phosphoribosyltransferase n=1 Tax=Legionella londiniensis TaxID=45068 RepID=A0A0W0VLM0_9GAMM|nr:anthranilate phosphoribosyltransferase [Legionella londiniensis]KTD20726.1 anthranilate phosphoribosyltransferase [Legionella londiniensis]STX92801.1 anthranilate phosphoribosyltransferase [Legionella londiniensis]